MSNPMEEDRFWWLALALGLLRELDERDNQYIGEARDGRD